MRLVIFDMDGLMFDTEAVAARAFEEIGREWGLQADLEIYKTLIALDKRDTCARYHELYGQDIDAELFYDTIGQRISKITQEEGVAMKPGLLPLLDAIEAAGLQKVIASSSEPETIEEFLEGCGLADRLDGVISSKEVARGKPAPDIFLEACRRYGVRPSEALVLEDSPEGIRAAAAGQIPVIGIPDLKDYSEEITQMCLCVGRTLEDVIPYLSL